MNTVPEASARKLKDRKSRSRLPRFGLRFLLIMILGIAIVFAWLGTLNHRAKKERRIIESMKTAMPSMEAYYDYELDEEEMQTDKGQVPGPLWLRKWFDDKMFSQIRKIDFVKDEDLTELKQARDLTGLKEIYLYKVNLNNLEDFRELGQLESLRCVFCNQLRDVSAISNLTKLEHAGLITSSKIKDITPISELPELRSLSLGPGNFDLACLSNLKQLEELNIGQIDHLKNVDMLNDLHHLNKLGLGAVSRLENLDGIQGKSNLTELTLVRCPKLTDLGPVWSLSNLKILKIESCPKIDDLTGITNLSMLEELTLGGLDQAVEDQALTKLSNLKKLTLGKLFEASNDRTSLDSLASLVELQEVEIVGLSMLSDVQALSHLSSLKKISFRQCPKLTPADMTQLQKSLPETEIVLKKH